MTASTTWSTAVNRDAYSFAGWFSLNPQSGIAAGTQIPANTQPEVDRIGIGKCQVYIDMINLTNIPTFVKIHFFKCMDDTTSNPLYYWDATAGLYTSSFAFSAAGTVPASTTTNNGNADGDLVNASTTVPGSLTVAPYTNLTSKRTVGKTWKKIKTVQVTLTGADTHRLTALIDMNLGVQRENANQGDSFMKGCVCFALETQGAAVLEDNIGTTLGGTKVGVAITRKVQLLPMKSSAARFQTYYQAQGLVQGGSVTTTKMIQPSLSTTQIGVTL